MTFQFAWFDDLKIKERLDFEVKYHIAIDNESMFLCGSHKKSVHIIHHGDCIFANTVEFKCSKMYACKTCVKIFEKLSLTHLIP